MAIRIPILTSFDPKGLKQANAAFAGLQTSIGSLGKNFAVIGAGVVGATALLSKAVMSASNFEAEFEGVNQVFKDAAGSVQAFAEAAAQTAGLSATEALRASKTFGLFATSAGLSATEAAKFSTSLVQLAGDLGSFNDLPTADALAAIQSGLQGQGEPLTKYGIFLTDLSLKQALFNATGVEVTDTLTAQQKMIAAYSQIFADTSVQQGDFVKYQETLGNQLKEVGADFQNLTRDIGMMLIPVITAAMPVIKEMSTEIGEKLKAAIGSVDWQSLITTLLNLATFFVVNAENIAKFVVGIFALNTAFKLMTVASGLVSVALAIQDWWVAKTTAGMTLATIATTILSAAMRLIPFVAVATAIGFVVTGIIQLGDQANRNKPYVDSYGGALRKSGDDALWAAQRYGIATNAANTLSQSLTYNQGIQNRLTPRQADEQARRAAAQFTPSSSFSMGNFTMPDFSSLLSQASSGGSSLNAELDRLNKEAEKASKEAEAAMKKIEDDAQAQREQSLAQEREVLDQRVNAYESFADSVKQLFGQIKDSIMSSFELPKLGNSVNSITKNIGKLLEKTKGFANNISKLAGLGLNSTLLQQVIGAGPMAGSQLASALVGGGSAFISQLNSAYGEFGGLASGIAGTGTSAAFASRATVNNYNIEVNGGMATGSDIGRAVVNAIKDYERQSGAAWRA
jgi:hypothetical protein